MKTIFLTFFLLIPLVSTAQKRVVVQFEGIFPFEPLSGRYVEKSLAPVATYIEDWRKYEPNTELLLKNEMGWGYKHYCTVVDTTLYPRVCKYLSSQQATKNDTLFAQISHFHQSKKFLQHFNKDMQAIKRYFATPLRVIDSLMEYNPYHENTYETLFHTFQKEITGAELSIFSPVNINARFDKEIYPKDVMWQLPYDNNLVVVEMNGQQIKDSLEKAFGAKYFVVKNENSDLLRHRVPAFLFQSISDVKFTVNLTKYTGRRIENWPLKKDEIYRVVMNSFLAKGHKVVEDWGDYKRLFIKWLEHSQNIAETTTNYTIQPRRIIEKIIRREAEIIFGESEN